ncbi:MAG TPA: aminotransferase class IV, partial [Chondromyces sp.]|nr:aminotransferase class IV [Chondromyces sp.]
MYVYINGRIIEKEKAAISPFDHGFLYGLGVFETFRTYEGHPFLLDDHVERLNAGLKELKIEKEFSRQEVLEIINRLSEKNGWENSYIRFNVSAGNGEIGLQTESYLNPSIIVFQKPLSVPGPIGEKEGVIL